MNQNVVIKIEDLPESVTELTQEQLIAIAGGCCYKYTSGSEGTYDDVTDTCHWDEQTDEYCDGNYYCGQSS
jgi:hypothetical protein